MANFVPLPVSGIVTANIGTTNGLALESTTAGLLTNTQLRATAVPVSSTQSGTWTTGRTWVLSSGTDSVTTVPSGTQHVAIDTQTAGIALDTTVSGLLTNTQLRASAVPTTVSNFPATQAVSSTDGALATVGTTTDASSSFTLVGLLKKIVSLLPGLGQKTMANSEAVVIASDQSAIPVSGTVTITPSGTQHVAIDSQAAGLALDTTVSGLLTNTQLRATAVPVSGSVTATVSGTVTANAGTNLNTSALALETGGNLAAIKTDTDSLATTVSGGKILTTETNSASIKTDLDSVVANQTSGGQKTQVTTLPALVTGTANIGNVGTVLEAAPLVGQTTSNTSAVQLSGSSSPATNGIIVQAMSTNALSVFIGPSGVTSSNGFELQAGQASSFTTTNITGLYVIGGNNTDKVCWSVL